MPFSALGLSGPILKALAEQGYTAPTPIQARAIPMIMAGKDLIAAAQTGTGKTASFVLPILEKLKDGRTEQAKRIRALILTPTRELAVQVEKSIAQYSMHLSLSSMAMYGGVDLEPQKQGLIEGVDILVATPGRLLDMANQRAVLFDEVEVLVLDEADRMLDMGFIGDINKIIERLPRQRQNLLFSATLSEDVRFLVKTTLYDAVEITIAADTPTSPEIDQCLITVDKDMKSALLSHLIKEDQWDQALIFIQTKHGAAKLVGQLEKRGIKAEAFHSGRSQASRMKVLADFKSGDLSFLVATGIASRGIDIDELTRVVNYDLPDEADDYIHRIGRTGRAGASGEAISFVSLNDFRNLCAIESRLGHIIIRKEIEGFAVRKLVPVSILDYVPKNRNSSSGDGQDTRRAQGKKNSASKGQRKTSSRSNKSGKTGNYDEPKKPSGGSSSKSNIWGKWGA